MARLDKGTDIKIKGFILFLQGRIQRKENPFIDIGPGCFIALALQAINDLEEGIDRYNRETIKSPVVGLAPMEYEILRDNIPLVAYRMFPKGFYRKVKEIYENKILEAPVEERDALRDM